MNAKFGKSLGAKEIDQNLVKSSGAEKCRQNLTKCSGAEKNDRNLDWHYHFFQRTVLKEHVPSDSWGFCHT